MCWVRRMGSNGNRGDSFVRRGGKEKNMGPLKNVHSRDGQMGRTSWAGLKHDNVDLAHAQHNQHCN